MHLSYSIFRQREKMSQWRSIAESYSEGQTVMKRTICPLGKLTDKDRMTRGKTSRE